MPLPFTCRGRREVSQPQRPGEPSFQLPPPLTREVGLQPGHGGPRPGVRGERACAQGWLSTVFSGGPPGAPSVQAAGGGQLGGRRFASPSLTLGVFGPHPGCRVGSGGSWAPLPARGLVAFTSHLVFLRGTRGQVRGLAASLRARGGPAATGPGDGGVTALGWPRGSGLPPPGGKGGDGS